MALKLLYRPRAFQGSRIIPDNRAASQRLDSIATVQRRLQQMLDEGRMLRQQIEVLSADLNLPSPPDTDTAPPRNQQGKKTTRAPGRSGRRKTDL
jgi:hypothetical protein